MKKKFFMRGEKVTTMVTKTLILRHINFLVVFNMFQVFILDLKFNITVSAVKRLMGIVDMLAQPRLGLSNVGAVRTGYSGFIVDGGVSLT